MTITAKNIGRINVWPTYAVAREADTEESKFTGQLTVWRTNEEALANTSYEEEGGGGAPAWVPANAVIHIDLVGGTPQGRAWVAGTGEVAVDTLLGSDPNTMNFFGPTGYDPAYLGADGYLNPTGGAGAAFIDAARNKLLAGATVVIKTGVIPEAVQSSTPLALTAADANAQVFMAANFGTKAVRIGDYNDDLGAIPDIIDIGVGVTVENYFAVTITPTRLEAAVNGSAPITAVLTEANYPTSGASQIVAALFWTDDYWLHSITLYDALPSTAGLSELSEV